MNNHICTCILQHCLCAPVAYNNENHSETGKNYYSQKQPFLKFISNVKQWDKLCGKAWHFGVVSYIIFGSESRQPLSLSCMFLTLSL